MITIENKPFSITTYYGGVYKTKDGKEYEFTIEHIAMENIGYIEPAVTWTEEEPENYKKKEQSILNRFNKTIQR
jgi:hypothetical protein